jgi:DNA-binding NarL/FixJ family response regulator
MLDRFDTIDILGSAEDVDDALDRCEEAGQVPDVVLVDTISADAERRIRSIVADLPESRVLALTVPNRESDILALTEVGIDGFVTADASVGELVTSIDSVARGEALCSPSVTAALMRRLAHLARERQPVARRVPLTTREWEILELIETGLSNKQIAVRLHIELATVKNHVHHILTKPLLGDFARHPCHHGAIGFTRMRRQRRKRKNDRRSSAELSKRRGLAGRDHEGGRQGVPSREADVSCRALRFHVIQQVSSTASSITLGQAACSGPGF